MIDFERVSGFEWDEGNDRKSQNRHGVSQAESEQVFYNEPRIAEDIGHSQVEPRFHALGLIDQGRRLHVTFTLRDGGTRIRVISSRDMNRKERRSFEASDVQGFA